MRHMNKKYLVLASHVLSSKDNEWLFINCNTLMELHYLDPKECICENADNDNAIRRHKKPILI